MTRNQLNPSNFSLLVHKMVKVLSALHSCCDGFIKLCYQKKGTKYTVKIEAKSYHFFQLKQSLNFFFMGGNVIERT